MLRRWCIYEYIDNARIHLVVTYYIVTLLTGRSQTSSSRLTRRFYHILPLD